eukprot:scaffold1967_cov199-Alexandrium_tamarense.AAC.52
MDVAVAKIGEAVKVEAAEIERSQQLGGATLWRQPPANMVAQFSSVFYAVCDAVANVQFAAIVSATNTTSQRYMM